MFCITSFRESRNPSYVRSPGSAVAQTTKLKPLNTWLPAACRVSWTYASSPSSNFKRRWQTQPNLQKSKSVPKSTTRPGACWLKVTRYGLLGGLLWLRAAARLSSALTLRLWRASPWCRYAASGWHRVRASGCLKYAIGCAHINVAGRALLK